MYPTMKRLLALTLTLVLICASACAASFTARSSGKSYFTFNYDVSRFSLDSESYLYGNAPGRSSRNASAKTALMACGGISWSRM